MACSCKTESAFDVSRGEGARSFKIIGGPIHVAGAISCNQVVAEVVAGVIMAEVTATSRAPSLDSKLGARLVAVWQLCGCFALRLRFGFAPTPKPLEPAHAGLFKSLSEEEEMVCSEHLLQDSHSFLYSEHLLQGSLRLRSVALIYAYVQQQAYAPPVLTSLRDLVDVQCRKNWPQVVKMEDAQTPPKTLKT